VNDVRLLSTPDAPPEPGDLAPRKIRTPSEFGAAMRRVEAEKNTWLS
jgi:hypothetical protein